MEQYTGIDASLDSASVCIVDTQGKILKEAKVASEPRGADRLVGGTWDTHGADRPWQAGPLSQWLFAHMEGGQAGSGVARDVRPVRAALQGHARQNRS